jgi:hypothetical protein
MEDLFQMVRGDRFPRDCHHQHRRQDSLKKIAVPLFHGVAGLVIFLGPFFTKGAPKGFFWVGIGGVLIGLGGIALAFISMGAQLLFFSPAFVMMILTPLLLLMTGAFALGFTKKG